MPLNLSNKRFWIWIWIYKNKVGVPTRKYHYDVSVIGTKNHGMGEGRRRKGTTITEHGHFLKNRVFPYHESVLLTGRTTSFPSLETVVAYSHQPILHSSPSLTSTAPTFSDKRLEWTTTKLKRGGPCPRGAVRLLVPLWTTRFFSLFYYYFLFFCFSFYLKSPKYLKLVLPLI